MTGASGCSKASSPCSRRWSEVQVHVAVAVNVNVNVEVDVEVNDVEALDARRTG